MSDPQEERAVERRIWGELNRKFTADKDLQETGLTDADWNLLAKLADASTSQMRAESIPEPEKQAVVRARSLPSIAGRWWGCRS